MAENGPESDVSHGGTGSTAGGWMIFGLLFQCARGTFLKMLDFSGHAVFAMAERGIPVEWVERVARGPALRTMDPRAPELERFYGRVPEFGNRILRVVLNTRVEPWRVVSVFFDRSMKGKL